MKIRIELLTVILFSHFAYLYSQEPTIVWQNTIGGTSADNLKSSYPTTDGGYILGGKSLSNISSDKNEKGIGGFDYWIVKINASGIIEWENTIGGSKNDELIIIKQTPDNGFIIGGHSLSDLSGDKTENNLSDNPIVNTWDFWIVKVNSSGIIEWDKTIGGTDNDQISDLISLDDGSFLIAGSSSSNISSYKTENSKGGVDFWLVKISSLGIIEWDKTIGGSDNDFIASIDNTNDEGFILSGSSLSDSSGDKTENSKGGIDYWLVKISSTGKVEWDKTIGADNLDQCNSVFQTTDGGYILGGISDSNTSGDKTENSKGHDDYWIIKVDSSGNVEWENTLGGSRREHTGYAVQTNDNQYLIIGSSDSNISGDKDENSLGLSDLWIIKLDSYGNEIWQKSIGGYGVDTTYETKFSIDGNDLLLGCNSFSGVSGDKTEMNIGNSDYWVVKLTDITLGVENVNFKSNLSVYPNPASIQLKIHYDMQQINEIFIYSLNGNFIDHFLDVDSNFFKIDISNYASGIYFAQIKSDGNVVAKKFIKN